ncbi:MAG TPA: NADH-quinone oxidoreductase subunit N [Thermoanaerobaculaceae bacterium]|nr:NADH-quinone oxidoreductase subunit N [Thermoanaerobaculaceae bacterium]
MSPTDLATILPELVLVLAGGALVLADAFAPRLRPRFGLLAGVAAVVALVSRWVTPLPGPAWSGALLMDPLARFVDTYILAALLLVAVMADPYLARTGARFGEFYGLLLWSATGAMVLAKADSLLVVFVALELLSISLYVLNAFHRESGISLEAGWKYLVVGAFASAFLLFGIALLYGATGSFSLHEIAGVIADGSPSGRPLLMVALALVLTGFGFKLALVPFHAWAPDVYQGAPTPVTAFLSVVPKGAALIVLARVIASVAPQILTPRWLPLLAAVAVASQTLGNLVAIAQRDVKRMLAYSGIAHMGYALVGLVAFGPDGMTGVLVYLAAYTFMNIGAFAVVSAFSDSEDEPHLITDLAGQGWERPILSFVLALSMFSLAGIPPTIGFVAKFLVFRAAVNEHLVWLAVVGVLNSLISVFFYVRVVYYLYMKPLPRRVPSYGEPWLVRLVAGACALAMVVLGVFPAWLVSAGELAARTLMR